MAVDFIVVDCWAKEGEQLTIRIGVLKLKSDMACIMAFSWKGDKDRRQGFVF